MAKIKKISINAMDKVIHNTYTPSTTVEWNGLEIIVKHNLTFIEMMNFVDSVTKTCFTSADGVYIPEVKEFAIKSNVLDRYTNITLPNNLGHRYDMIYCTDIVDTVFKHINSQQLDEIITAIDEKVKNRAQANIESINKQMSDLYTAFDNLQNNVTQMFDGVDNNVINSFIKTMVDGSIDETKLAEAYIAQSKLRVDA